VTTSPSAAEARAWAAEHGLLDAIRAEAASAPPLPEAARTILRAWAAELRRREPESPAP